MTNSSLQNPLSFRHLLAAVVIPVFAFLGTSLFMSIPPDTHGVDTKQGLELFRAHCGSCHFAKAGFPAHHGPNLYDIGRTGANRKSDLSAAEYILESVLDPSTFIAPSGRPGMPPNVASHLAPDEIRNIVGFLASCGTSPDYDEIVALEIPDLRPPPTETTSVRLSEMLAAEQLLREKGGCVQCHALFNTPDGQLHAPAIFGVGLNDRTAVRESILKPQKEIQPKYVASSVVLTTGESFMGRIMNRSDEGVTLCLRDANSHLTWRQLSLEDIEHDEDGQLLLHQSELSLMPDGFGELLTPDELESLITLILQLN